MVILWNFLDALRVRGLQAVVSDDRNAKLKSNCLYISNGKFNYYPANAWLFGQNASIAPRTGRRSPDLKAPRTSEDKKAPAGRKLAV